ncbi:MAG: diguanylate cyclase [Prochlorothrix sp.]|nr:diguanylate cyclase [Prochlorothrix sp.]
MKYFLRRCRLKPMLIIPFVGQMVGLVGIVGWLSFQASHRAVETLGIHLMGDVSARINQYLDRFIDSAMLPYQLALTAVQRQDFDADLSQDNPQRDQLLLQWLSLNQQVTWISIGSAVNGDYHGVYRNTGQELQVVTANQRTGRDVWYYATDGQRRRDEDPVLREAGPYDSRSRPWYQIAAQSRRPVWSAPYAGYTPNTTFVSFSAPLAPLSNSAPNAVAKSPLPIIMAVDINLSHFRTYLQQLIQDLQGTVVILDETGNLVAASSEEPSFSIQADQSTEPVPLPQSQSPLLQSVGTRIRDQALLNTPDVAPFLWAHSFDRQKYWVSLQPYHPNGSGDASHLTLDATAPQPFDWFILILIPESTFMAEIHANTRLTIGLCLLALGTSVLTGVIMARWIVRPLEHLSHAAQDLAQGNLDRRVQTNRWDEVGRLEQAFNHMAQQLKDAFAQIEIKVEERTRELAEAKRVLERANGQLQTLATVDGLTQIPNRRCFDETLGNLWYVHKEIQSPLSLILVDIDYFKQYNDCYGHLQGDWVLQTVAQCLTQTVQDDQAQNPLPYQSPPVSQPCPRPPGGLVSRYGGEEFAILLPQTSESVALSLAQRLCDTVAQQAIDHCQSSLGILTISLGLSTLVPPRIPHPTLSPTRLIHRADQALYQAKHQGRNQVVALRLSGTDTVMS